VVLIVPSLMFATDAPLIGAVSSSLFGRHAMMERSLLGQHEVCSMRLRSLALITSQSVAVLALAAAAADPQFWQTPAIAGAGRIHPLRHAAYQPSPNETYKLVFPLTQAGKSPGEASPALDRVARAVNLFASAGVALDHLKMVAVMHGAATDAALKNDAYRAKYGVDNPNLALIAKLRQAGVDVAVCGQALAAHEDQFDWVDPHVTLSLSALTTVAVLEQRGYSVVPE